MNIKAPVIVLQVPEKLVLGSAHLFFREIQEFLQVERPRLVLDFSEVTQVDSAGIEMLLNCMEEAMKRNGDVKLAAIATGPAVVLELTQVDRLFEIFADASEAAKSFHQFPVQAIQQMTQPWSESAANHNAL
ncbi:MAG: STAS domain-containing protein [Terriglobales bacterium]